MVELNNLLCPVASELQHGSSHRAAFSEIPLTHLSEPVAGQIALVSGTAACAALPLGTVKVKKKKKSFCPYMLVRTEAIRKMGF